MKISSSASVFLALMVTASPSHAFLATSPKLRNNGVASSRVHPKAWSLDYKRHQLATPTANGTYTLNPPTTGSNLTSSFADDRVYVPKQFTKTQTSEVIVDMSDFKSSYQGLTGPSKAGLVLAILLTGGMVLNAPDLDISSFDAAFQAVSASLQAGGLDLDFSSLSLPFDFDSPSLEGIMNGKILTDALHNEKFLELSRQWGDDIQKVLQTNPLANLEEFKAPLTEQSAVLGAKLQAFPTKFQEWTTFMWAQAQTQADQMAKTLQEALPFHAADEFFSDVGRVAAAKSKEFNLQSQAVMGQAQTTIQEMAQQQLAASEDVVSRLSLTSHESMVQAQTALADLHLQFQSTTNKEMLMAQDVISSTVSQVEDFTSKVSTTWVPNILRGMDQSLSTTMTQTKAFLEDSVFAPQVTGTVQSKLLSIKESIPQVALEAKQMVDSKVQELDLQNQVFLGKAQGNLGTFMADAKLQMTTSMDQLLSSSSQDAMAQVTAAVTNARDSFLHVQQEAQQQVATNSKSVAELVSQQSQSLVAQARESIQGMMQEGANVVSTKIFTLMDHTAPPTISVAEPMSSSTVLVHETTDFQALSESSTTLNDMLRPVVVQQQQAPSVVKETSAEQLDRLQRMVLEYK